MNLHDKRFIRNVEKPQEWKFCAIPNQYRAAQWKNSIDTSGCFVVLTSLAPVSTRDGRPPRYEAIRFRGSNPQELRETISKQFPDAIFTTGNPEPETDLKAQHAAEMRQEKERLAALAEQNAFTERYNTAYDDIVRNLTPAERDEAFDQAVHEFIMNPKFSNPEWVAKFRAFPNLMSYPDNSWQNKKTLQAFCKQRGWVCPQAAQLGEAFNYLFQHGHLHLKPSYKRSEIDERNAVLPFVRETTLAESFSPQQIAEAAKRLRAALPVGSVPSDELVQLRAKQLGISNDLLQILLHRHEEVRAGIKDWSAERLRDGLQQMRNEARGNVARSRGLNMRGY